MPPAAGTRYSSQSDQRSRQGSESGSSSCYCAATSGHWLAAGTTAGAVLLYDLRMACKAAEAAGAHQGSTFSVALQGSRLASGGEDGVVLAWDVGRLAGADSRAVAEGVQRQREAQAGRRQHSGCVYSVRLGQEWQVASAGAEGRAVVWRWQEASGGCWAAGNLQCWALAWMPLCCKAPGRHLSGLMDAALTPVVLYVSTCSSIGTCRM